MVEKKTHWKKAFNKDYLGAWDIEEGDELKLIIDHIELKDIKDVSGNSTQCNVAQFTDKKIKPMILNVGACKQIQRFSGEKYIEKWGGTAIQVYVLEGVKAFGEVTDALRIRDHQPRMESDKEELTPDHKKWQGAVKKYAENQNIDIVKKYFVLSESNEKKLISEASIL